ncbi:MAG: DUF167 domain-containing protein [Nanoarchaeota archaeon]
MKQFLKGEKFEVWAKPKSSKSILEWDEEKQKIIAYLNSAPEDGKANHELIKLFKKEQELKVKLVAGEKSRKKLLKVL